MTESPSPTNPFLVTTHALLKEIASYPITDARLMQALPLMGMILAEIRRIDEVDLESVEPAIGFHLGT